VTPNPRWPDGLCWTGATVVILASGPSLSRDQCDFVRVWRNSGMDRRVIVLNTTFRMALWADVLYACDHPWWDHYHNEVKTSFGGATWTQDAQAKYRYGINQVASMKLPGLNDKPGVINQGGNSGYQAIGLAYIAGASRIVLLGYDMRDVGGESHWHGDHPPLLRRPNSYRRWLPEFTALAADLKARDVTVINCTPDSELKVFEMMSLHAALS
jgi:hypothetical protein